MLILKQNYWTHFLPFAVWSLLHLFPQRVEARFNITGRSGFYKQAVNRNNNESLGRVKWYSVRERLTSLFTLSVWIESEWSLWWVTGSGRAAYISFDSPHHRATRPKMLPAAELLVKTSPDIHARTQQTHYLSVCLVSLCPHHTLSCLLGLHTQSTHKVAFITTNTRLLVISPAHAILYTYNIHTRLFSSSFLSSAYANTQTCPHLQQTLLLLFKKHNKYKSLCFPISHSAGPIKLNATILVDFVVFRM